MLCCIVGFVLAVIHGISMVLSTLVFVLASYVFLKFIYKRMYPEQRKIVNGYKEQWFGKEPRPIDDEEDTSIRPFKIDVPEEVLSDLKSRLENTRFEDPVEDSKFLYGFNPNYLRKVVDYWKRDYDWRKHEKMLNQFPQFKTCIEGIDVHFLHVKPDLPEGSKHKVLPLLIVHGWPGSIVEFYKIIPLLTTPRPDRDFVFEVICPSIPGYGFSESPHRAGFTIRSAARIFNTMMERIGHRRYYVQGGDWGSIIVFQMARHYSPRILGLHLNMYAFGMTKWEGFKFLLIAFFPFLAGKAEYKLSFPIKNLFKKMYAEGGYYHLQSTKPDTIGCGMVDSPAGTAAYLLEKFCYWVNPEHLNQEDGGLTKKFSLDELLTNVMVYWVNNNFTAAARFYKENSLHRSENMRDKSPIYVPSAIAAFPNELIMFPKTCTSQQLKNLISYNIMPRGGHFAAFEEPELLADDVWQFAKAVENQNK